MSTRNERRLQRKRREAFMSTLMRPYQLIAKRTSDPDARTAILALIDMLAHATSVMESYDMGAPVNDVEETFLEEAVKAFEEDDDAALGRLREKYGK